MKRILLYYSHYIVGAWFILQTTSLPPPSSQISTTNPTTRNKNDPDEK